MSSEAVKVGEVKEKLGKQDSHYRKVVFQALDFNLPIEDQDEFDIIIHKLSEEIGSRYLDHKEHNKPQNQDHEKLSYIEMYLQRNKNTLLIDSPLNVVNLMSRE